MTQKPLTHEAIACFFGQHMKKKNDGMNKLREYVVVSYLNKNIPLEWFSDSKWQHLANQINGFITTMVPECDNPDMISAALAAGRSNHYDFDIWFTRKTGTRERYCVEFKYGTNSVKGCPQFVSPMKPSQFFANTEEGFERFYYNNHLSKVILDKKTMPTFDQYNKDVHSVSPSCLHKEQLKYYAGCSRSSKFTNDPNDIEYYELCKQVSSQAIQEFILQTDIDLPAMNEYLR